MLRIMHIFGWKAVGTWVTLTRQHRRVRWVDRALRGALTANGGIVSRAQLLAIGLSASAIAPTGEAPVSSAW